MARTSRRHQTNEVRTTAAPITVDDRIKTAAYVRLSVEQEDDETIQNQAEYIKEFIKRQDDLELAGIYMDHGYTGTNFDRPEFSRLMMDVQSGMIGCIVVKDLSRFGRNFIETGYYLETLLPKLNVRLIAINDNYDSDRDEDRANLAVPVKNMVNEMYARDQSRKVSLANERARANGTYTIEHSVYGYILDKENNNYIVNPDTAPIVQLAYRWFLQGISCGQIADRFNKMNIMTPQEYKYINELHKEWSGKQIWNSGKVRDLFKRDVYAGDLVLGMRRQQLYKNLPKDTKVPREEWTIYKDHHDAIVPREDVEAVHKMLRENVLERRRVVAANETLNQDYNRTFNKLVYCKTCNRIMYQDTKSYKDGKRKAVGNTYMCKGRIGEHDRNGCYQSINDDYLRTVVTDQVRNLAKQVIDTNQLLQKLKKRQDDQFPIMKYQNRIARLTLKEEQCMSKIGKLYEDLSSEIIDQDDYRKFRNQYQKERFGIMEQIKESRQQLEKVNSQILSFEELAEKLYQHLDDVNLSRELAEALIDKIYVDGGKVVEIQFKCADIYQDVLNMLKAGEGQ